MNRFPLKWLTSWHLAFVSLLAIYIPALVEKMLLDQHIADRCASWNDYPDFPKNDDLALIIMGIGIVLVIAGGTWALVHVAARQKAPPPGDPSQPGPVNFGYGLFIVAILVIMAGYGLAVFTDAQECLRYTNHETFKPWPDFIFTALVVICVPGMIIGSVWGLFSFFSNLERRRRS